MITFETFGTPGWEEMVRLRHQVLRAPLGLEFSQDQLAAEVNQLHLALWLDDTLAGTLLLLRPDPTGTGKLRQMAVRPGLERRGFGSRLVGRGEAELQRLGAVRAGLSARTTAIPFYERLGYVAYGEPFIEVTVPHRSMRRRLDDPA
ncbi:GNAT family N-acetyltransferase [Lichenicola sp.]|uniref:GNAT family N-acetyltransferase n=1 Tax=Lichenicola sp. TaxID=2804529 RepID=UPI003B0047B9